MISLQTLEPTQWILISTLFGLCIGSFVNVVVHRLPIMMQAQWDDELALANDQTPEPRPRFNLLLPSSHCPACKTPLRFRENVPVLSWLLLRGKCSNCGVRISGRYPLVELFVGLGFGWLAYSHNPGWQAIAWMLFFTTLVCLALIDLDTYLLPDDLTLPLVWGGLLFNLFSAQVPLEMSVIGAVSGYMMLWLIYHAFKLVTGKEGMGYGDFKLLAAGGAWFGVESLFTILLTSSLAGIVFGVAIQTIRGLKKTEAFPFGPSLVFGMFCWMGGFNILDWVKV